VVLLLPSSYPSRGPVLLDGSGSPGGLGLVVAFVLLPPLLLPVLAFICLLGYAHTMGSDNAYHIRSASDANVTAKLIFHEWRLFFTDITQ
jgi:hypothetical protein